MSIAPVTLSEMLASTGLEDLRKTVVARLKALLKGVTVVEHPGKLDINDVLAKAIVTAPGVAIGWVRIREARDLDQGYSLGIDFVAYIVAENYADQAGKRAFDRTAVAMAIGAQLLLILSDEDTATWGLGGVAPPAADPGPEMRPVFTMKSADQGASLYVVTWTQWLLRQGRPKFGGPTPKVEGLPDGMVFEMPPDGDEIPTEFLALLHPEGRP
ncbi:hypothetical protein [Methylorubrum zatmanii]